MTHPGGSVSIAPAPNVVLGAIWRSRRRGESHRRVRIQWVEEERVGVWRNTSRRTQSISVATLLKDYAFVCHSSAGWRGRPVR